MGLEKQLTLFGENNQTVLFEGVYPFVYSETALL